MKKLLFIIIIPIQLLGYSARMDVIGLNHYIDDYLDPLYNPATLSFYNKNIVGIEFDNIKYRFSKEDSDSVVIPISINRQRWVYLFYDGKFGIVLNKKGFQGIYPLYEMGFTPDSIELNFQNYIDEPVPGNIVDILYSMKINNNSIGININFGMRKKENIVNFDTLNNIVEINSNSFGFKCGYISSFIELTAGINLLYKNAEYKDLRENINQYFNNNNIQLIFSIKRNFIINRRMKLVFPFIEIIANDFKVVFEKDNLEYKPEYSKNGYNFILGSGLLWERNIWKFGLVNEIEIRKYEIKKYREYISSSENEKSFEIIFPRIKIGSEVRLFSWLSMRGGMTYSLISNNETSNINIPNNLSEKSYETLFHKNMNMKFGFGINLGGYLLIDSEIEKNIFYKGPYLLSEFSGTDINPLIIKISAIMFF